MKMTCTFNIMQRNFHRNLIVRVGRQGAISVTGNRRPDRLAGRPRRWHRGTRENHPRPDGRPAIFGHG
jgi:hypothetical protein